MMMLPSLHVGLFLIDWSGEHSVLPQGNVFITSATASIFSVQGLLSYCQQHGAFVWLLFILVVNIISFKAEEV